MPIYEQGYRRWEARGPLSSVRFWPITREALRMLLVKRAFLGLLAVAWLPLVVRVGQIFIVTRFPEVGRALPVDGRLFGEFLNGQIFFALVVSIFGGAGLVSNDLRTGAILVYLSRPLTRRDYVAGKLLVLLALNFAVTLVPGLLLYAVALALVPEQFLLWRLAWIGPALVLHAVTLSLAVSLLALALSALTTSARVAGLSFFGLVFGLEMVRGIFERLFDRPEAALLSVQWDVRAVGAALFGLGDAGGLHWGFAALALAALALGSLAVLRSRVRAVEIVT